MGKANGPMVFSKHHDLSGLGLNGREIEALNLNHASLEVAWFNRLLGTGGQLTLSIIVIDQSLSHWWWIIYVCCSHIFKLYFYILYFMFLMYFLCRDVPEAALNHWEPFQRHLRGMALNRSEPFSSFSHCPNTVPKSMKFRNRSKPLWTKWEKWQAITRNRTKPFRAAWRYFLLGFIQSSEPLRAV